MFPVKEEPSERRVITQRSVLYFETQVDKEVATQ